MLVNPNDSICSYSPFISAIVFFLINLGIWIFFAVSASNSCGTGGNDMDCSFYTFALIGHSVFLLFVILALCMVVRQFRRVREMARQRQADPYFNNGQGIYGNDGMINPYRYNPANVGMDYQTNPQGYNNYNPNYHPNPNPNYNLNPNPNPNQPYAYNYAPPRFYASN